MFTRTITLKTNPATQCTLYFDTLENAVKGPQLGGGSALFNDDYGNRVVISDFNDIASDMLSDTQKHFAIKAQQKIDEMFAGKQFQEFVEKNREIKDFLERQANQQRQQNHG